MGADGAAVPEVDAEVFMEVVSRQIQTLGWKEFTREVLDLYEGPQKASSTHQKMKRALTLAFEHGARSSADLTTSFAARYVKERSKVVSINTVRGELRYLKAAANYAVEEDWLFREPKWRRVWPRKGPRARRVLYEIEEIAAVLGHLRYTASDWRGERLHALFATVAYTGLRRDEALYLRTTDVDLGRMVIDVVDRPERRLKTEESEGPVPIPGELRGVLARWLPMAGEWLFPNQTRSGPWTGGSYGTRPTESIRKAAEEIGVEGLTLLALRHSYATWARRRWGMNARQLMNILRHTSETTQANYVQPDVSDLVESVANVSYRLTRRKAG